MLKKILIGLAVIVVAFLGYAATRPSEFHVERSASLSAPAEVVFTQLNDLRKWAAWSPWEKLDPNMTKTFAGPEQGVGASYTWQGNDQAGKGKMTIVKEDPPKQIVYKLEFMEPFESVAETTFNLEQSGPEQTKITWGMVGHNNFVGKVFCVFMDPDNMIGADFEKGLAQLKTVAEAEAKKKKAEEAAAAQAAAEPAAAPAP
jgi:uncharacterized protein YndB with AHSA1/START domain